MLTRASVEASWIFTVISSFLSFSSSRRPHRAARSHGGRAHQQHCVQCSTG